MAGHGVHVIVVGNEKGGSGKSTTAFHLAIYLLYQGYKVASIDVDSRQQTLTHYVRNRRAWAKGRDLRLPHTTHFHLPVARGDSLRENHKVEFDLFRQAVGEVEHDADFVVIDTPGFDTNLTRLAHSLADTLVTPVNDSLIDLNVMAQIDPVTGEPREMSHYSRLVQRARSERLAIDGRTVDWVLVRNRISMLSSRNMRQVQTMLERIALRLGCRVADGIAERVIFRSLFPAGLTVFDPLDEDMLGGVPSMSHTSARQQYRNLVEALHLPVSERAEARKALSASLSPHKDGSQRFVHMLNSEI
ncbi:division plane positioning ATPase MipZ [Devosia neptuniae]|uniref:division plane positioning ATPase MipZ n=1 Tax=Devosia neptuniae TaxID=191302 RepID=UPI0022AF22A8|nr:division plane positioning ATPase MipZ [Devosia neptuniae]MCZ4345321.1 AAA family ATPase [Devosia neptuniae]|tara:strand:- start:7639 stop:8547 length:909 start_codon:yes stop_codon:yes gene_type:complete